MCCLCMHLVLFYIEKMPSLFAYVKYFKRHYYVRDFNAAGVKAHGRPMEFYKKLPAGVSGIIRGGITS